MEEQFCGGNENCELDHFKPKSKFPEEASNFYNLYYSCHVCNRTKHAHWPDDELRRNGKHIVDLCADDAEKHFGCTNGGLMTARTNAGSYTIYKLRLNRPHLITLRVLLRIEFGLCFPFRDKYQP